MKTPKFLLALLFNCLIGILLASFTDWNPFICMAGVNVAGAVMYQVKLQYGISFFDGLATEVWLPDVKEDPYPDASFVNAATDMSALVDNDKINLTEAGVDPDVLKNNTVYPVPDAVAADSPLSIELNYYDTTSTIVRNAVAIELAYDQRTLYANKHKKALAKRIGQDAAYSYAPAQHNAANFNTVLNLAANDSIIDAIIDMKAAFTGQEGVNLVLDPTHMAKIAKEDKVLFKAIMAEKGATFYGFKIWEYTHNPFYIGATGAKAAFGAAFVAGTHKRSSFVFVGSEVMRADGTIKMFSRLNDPDIKGDKFNFQKRTLVLPLRNKFQGAILQ